MSVIEDSKVIHAGTMNSGNPSVAAALATVKLLEKENPYSRIFKLGKELMEGLKKASEETAQNMLIQGPGPMFNVSFTNLKAIKDYRDTLASDQNKLKQFIALMHDRGVRIIGRGLWYISTAHDKDDIDKAIQTAREVLGLL
jgi:glutamate-1-semialdehyde 2,1-aminomutase